MDKCGNYVLTLEYYGNIISISNKERVLHSSRKERMDKGIKRYDNGNWKVGKEEMETLIEYAVLGMLSEQKEGKELEKEKKELIEYIYYEIMYNNI